MNISALTKAGTRGLHRSLLVTKKYSPELLTAVGITGMVGTAVLAARATLRMEPVLDRLESRMAAIEALKNSNLEAWDEDKEKVYSKDKLIVHAQAAFEIAKLYAPTVTLGTLSAISIVAAHGIMKKRNVALLAAYKVVEEGYASYRKRVIDEFGEEKDRDYRFGLFDEEIEVEDEETGKTKKQKVKKASVDPNQKSTYARCFDQLSEYWEKVPEYNLIFLRAQQNYFNDRLQAKGHVFLNEVYDALGIPRSQAGNAVGWFLGKEGDNFIDFGIYDTPSFVRGDDLGIWLDFNVDGVILDKLP